MPLTLIAILPPKDISEKVKGWKEYMLWEYGCKVALKSPAHITLIPPFQVSKENTERLIGFIGDFSSACESFEIQLHNFNCFAPRVIYVDVMESKDLEAMKNDLESRMLSASFPVKKEDRPFHPHVTLANRDLDRKDFKPAWNHFSSMQYRASFTADAITVLQHDGSRWNVVSMLPLQFPPAVKK